jgi:hypothetical protein
MSTNATILNQIWTLQGNGNFRAARFTHVTLQANTLNLLWLHIFGTHLGSALQVAAIRTGVNDARR